MAERTRDWALLHRIITQPDLAGRAKIYSAQSGVRDGPGGGRRNAFAEDAAKFEAKRTNITRRGSSMPRRPSRPLNPDRDVYSTAMTSDEGELMRADLLGPGSRRLSIRRC